MASNSSKEQLATVQMDALNTSCLHFADTAKKSLKHKLQDECLSTIKLKNYLCMEKKVRYKTELGIHSENYVQLMEVYEVLEEGTETGLPLSPEEVKRLKGHMGEAFEVLDELE